MVTFINDHRAIYGVEPICRVLPIAPSTYYAHAARLANPVLMPARAKRDAAAQPNKFNACGRTSACMEFAKCGGNWHEKASRLPAAPWSG